MSTQRGNIKRSRAPKHDNTFAFNPLKFDTNKRSIKIAETEVVQVS